MRAVSAVPTPLNVLVVANLREEALSKIRAVDSANLNVTAAYAEFYDETLEDNAAMMGRPGRRGAPPPQPLMTPAEREATLAAAHAVFLSFPFPHHLLPRAKNAILFHCPFAGVSNLRGTPYWDASVPFTSARGYTQAEPIAELAVSAATMLAKGLHVAARKTLEGDFDRRNYPLMRVLEGKTMGIVGFGGIGRNVARLAKGLGMRVAAARRSARSIAYGMDGVDALYPPGELHAMLAEADFVVVAAMWTDETHGMMDAAAFAAMKDGAAFINVARGEIVDEAALANALRSGKLSGAYLDVYVGDFTGPPNPTLASAPNLVITPHTSGSADVNRHGAVDVFCRNLRSLLGGEPLENVIDWRRGY